MKSEKMTKQVRKMVEEVNEYCRYRHVKDTADSTFNTMCWLLLRSNCYHGFNYFTLDGELSGGDNEQFDHLELYIK